MTEWTRFNRPVRCGACGAALPADTPVRVTHIAGISRDFLRCQECVGAAPSDVPAHELPPRPARVEAAFVSLKDVGKATGWMPYRDE